MVTREQLLDALPDSRREAVRAWLESEIGSCSRCGRPLRITDPHEKGDDGHVHLDCGTEQQPQASALDETVSPAVAARARRSDWG